MRLLRHNAGEHEELVQLCLLHRPNAAYGDWGFQRWLPDGTRLSDDWPSTCRHESFSTNMGSGQRVVENGGKGDQECNWRSSGYTALEIGTPASVRRQLGK